MSEEPNIPEETWDNIKANPDKNDAENVTPHFPEDSHAPAVLA